MAVWFNGKIEEEALSDATSAGILLGWGVFTTIGVRGAVPWLLDQHCERLVRDAIRAEIGLTPNGELIRQGVLELIKRNQITDGLARVTVIRRGDGRWSSGYGIDIVITAIEAELPLGRLDLWVSPTPAPFLGALAGVKSTSYLPFQLAWQQARRAGCHDALLLNHAGHIAETARANIFWLSNGQAFTPSLSTGCLEGVGREVIMEILNQIGVTTVQTEARLDELLAADLVFSVSAAAGPLLVNQVEEEGVPHRFASNEEIFQNLGALWQKTVFLQT